MEPKTILVIDDDPDIWAYLEAILEPDGYKVLTAENGEVGLRMAREHNPDVILLDVMMPVMDGYEFLDKQSKDPAIAEIPIIVLSGGTHLERIPSEIPKLPKPPELSALFALIESRVNRPHQQPHSPILSLDLRPSL